VTIGQQVVIPKTCTFYVGNAIAAGQRLDCVLVAATTSTTQNNDALCWATWTAPASSTPTNQWVTVNFPASCGSLGAGTSWFLWQAGNFLSANPLVGAYDCPSGCTGTVNSGTFGSYYFAAAYGTYNNLTTNLASFHNSNQQAVFITSVPLNHQP
jgi:hypothetical protein